MTAFTGPHDTVIVFTQYTDTMDYIREQLVTQFQGRVGCYSGRGGRAVGPEARSLGARTPRSESRTLFSGRGDQDPDRHRLAAARA